MGSRISKDNENDASADASRGFRDCINQINNINENDFRFE